MALNLKRYLQFTFLASVLFIIIGFVTGKISVESFTYISLVGSVTAIFKILLVALMLLLGLAMSLPALIADLILLFMGFSFPLLEAIWGVIWGRVTIGWFWGSTSGSSVLFGSIILAVISAFAMKRR